MGLWTDIVGSVRGYIRLGLTGVRLKNSSGALAVRNAGDSSYAGVECGTLKLAGLQQLDYSADISSGATVDLGTATGNSVTVTHSSGTTAITSFGGAATAQKGTIIAVIPSISGGTLTVTHHATNMILLGGVNITLASGDVLLMMKNHDSNAEWKQVGGWKADGTAWVTTAAGTTLTIGPFTAWTSGAYKDITGLSGVKRLTISPKSLSTSGTSNLLIQIGAGTGGLKTSGYESACTNDGGSRATSTAGFLVSSISNAAYVRSGTVVLTLVDSSNNTWAMSGQISETGSGLDANSGGQVTLSGPLDRFRFTTVGGTDTGDAGGFGYSVEV